MTLVDKETKEVHPYVKTASKIVAYSKYVKDEKKETFPVLGICQGLEVIGVILNKGEIEVLDRIVEYGVNRNVNWKVDPKKESQLWKDFEREVVEYMAQHPSVLHAHTYSISVETYMNIPKLQSFMKVT